MGQRQTTLSGICEEWIAPTEYLALKESNILLFPSHFLSGSRDTSFNSEGRVFQWEELCH